MITKFYDFKYMMYCDLDGVLCDFDGAFRKLIPEEEAISLLEEIQNDLGNSVFTKYGLKHGWKSAWKIIEDYGPDFYYDLEWLPDGKKMWKYLIENFKRVEILTGSPLFEVGEWAKKAKNKWCAEELGESIIVNHKEGKYKQQFVKTPYDILVDDAPRNYRNWKEAGGIAILHSSADQTIKELEQL